MSNVELLWLNMFGKPVVAANMLQAVAIYRAAFPSAAFGGCIFNVGAT